MYQYFRIAAAASAIMFGCSLIGPLQETENRQNAERKYIYCGVAPRGRSIERPLLINGYAYLAVSLPDKGPVDSNS
jgi:hypothetical protein